jgi:proteasome lid subunit RPN8/RPN11
LKQVLKAGIWLEPEHWVHMLLHVSQAVPEEACGLVAGEGNRSRAVFSITNALHSPVRFRMDPQEQVNAILEIERRGWDILAIYHSHPHGPQEPSPTDILEYTYPGTIYLIFSRQGESWICRGYVIMPGEVREASVQIGENK